VRKPRTNVNSGFRSQGGNVIVWGERFFSFLFDYLEGRKQIGLIFCEKINVGGLGIPFPGWFLTYILSGKGFFLFPLCRIGPS
jgi:hypothetical protein